MKVEAKNNRQVVASFLKKFENMKEEIQIFLDDEYNQYKKNQPFDFWEKEPDNERGFNIFVSDNAHLSVFWPIFDDEQYKDSNLGFRFIKGQKVRQSSSGKGATISENRFSIKDGKLNWHWEPKNSEPIWIQDVVSITGLRKVIKVCEDLLSDEPFEPEIPEEHQEDIERKKEFYSRLSRTEQTGFRSQLMNAYKGRCAFSNTNAQHTLQAAHIVPHNKTSNDSVNNGLLLRADIHLLFDAGLIKISPDTLEIKLDETISAEYGNIINKKLELPNSISFPKFKKNLQDR